MDMFFDHACFIIFSFAEEAQIKNHPKIALKTPKSQKPPNHALKTTKTRPKFSTLKQRWPEEWAQHRLSPC